MKIIQICFLIILENSFSLRLSNKHLSNEHEIYFQQKSTKLLNNFIKFYSTQVRA